jgi:hypothetical protein
MTTRPRTLVIRGGKLVFAPREPQQGDSAPRERTRLTQTKPALDVALAVALFEDLALWREECGMRVRHLPLRPLGETLETITPKVREMFTAVGIAPEALAVENAEKHEAHRGEVRIMIPEQEFSQHTQRMKQMLHDARRSEEVGRVGR